MSDTLAPLLTVHSSDSTTSSSVSQRRLMRLSEKMSLVKSRRTAGALSPTNPAVSSPMYASKRNVKLSSQTNNNGEDNFGHVPEEDEEEDEEEEGEDEYSECSSPGEHEKRVGMISPVADTPRGRRDDEEGMDRIESRRAERPEFLAQPALMTTPLKEAATEDKDGIHNTNKRTRIPGGAAAKLMLMGPQKSNEEDSALPTPRPSPDSSTGSEKQNQLQAALDRARNQVKSQFNLLPGSTTNDKESNEEPMDWEDYRRKLIKESPNLFDPKEVFHKDAEAAMQALLTARGFMNSDSQSVYSRSSFGGNLSTHPSDNISYNNYSQHSDCPS